MSMTQKQLTSPVAASPLLRAATLPLSPIRPRAFRDVTGSGDVEVETRRYREHTVVALTASFRGISEPGEQEASESTVFLDAAEARALGSVLVAERDTALANRLHHLLVAHGHRPQAHDLAGLVAEVAVVLRRL